MILALFVVAFFHFSYVFLLSLNVDCSFVGDFSWVAENVAVGANKNGQEDEVAVAEETVEEVGANKNHVVASTKKNDAAAVAGQEDEVAVAEEVEEVAEEAVEEVAEEAVEEVAEEEEVEEVAEEAAETVVAAQPCVTNVL